ncbi:protein S100-B-like [Oncorhynchus kisutch]|uniref:protein S100-B-like n=1 Tax=Oncorhynchus kisutch TaxID=8019 RepID=UPI0009A03F84|nr:protein S100-B-like [Oncorhynchus kisutch]XP_031679932.1 protein S100-B-like [Oncorhynchus kisutch]
MFLRIGRADGGDFPLSSRRLFHRSRRGRRELESAMIAIIHVFHKYSGHKCKLKKAELKELVNNEMSHFIINIQEKETLDELFADLDQNGDLEIDFQEFIALIAMMTSTCHDLFSTDHRR